MTFAPIFRFLAFALFAVGGAALVPFVIAVTLQELRPGSFAIAIFLTLFVGACFYALSSTLPRGRAVRSGFRELVLTLFLFWAAVPFAAAIPFLGREFSFWGAWFEAVSSLTTTGAWLSEPAARATISGMLYRASLEWLGGLVSLGTAAAVFVRPEFVGIAPPVPPFARGKQDSYLRAFSAAVRAFAPVYVGLTFAAFLAFFISGVPASEAGTLALSLMASGGFTPEPGGLLAYSPITVFIAVVVMVLSAVNFVVIARLAIQGSGRLKSHSDAETKALLLLILPVALLFWVSSGAGDWDLIPVQVVNAVSLLSTNGFIVGRAPELTPVLVTVVIGGAAVSTAGGIKLLRWLITFRRAGEELWQLSHPGAVHSRRGDQTVEFGVWIHTIAFTMVLAALTLTIALWGYDLELAAATAVAVVANAGPALAAVEGSTADFILFEEPLRVTLALGMIAGRLELVLLLLLIDREFWQA
ncbi:MAG: potassium transporter TrkG [Parvularcula sp.]|jgi:trk system potassium uptake protein TrkH|nr:potassium transporter TrkG [Parvularcula sp.]